MTPPSPAIDRSLYAVVLLAVFVATFCAGLATGMGLAIWWAVFR